MELSVSPSSRSSSCGPVTGMRSPSRSSETRFAVPLMRLSGASTRPATSQPTAAATNSTPAKATAYWSATSSSASWASASGSVRSKWRASSQ